MKDGYYWLKEVGCDPEVVEILENSMRRLGDDVFYHLSEGQWINGVQWSLDVEYLKGPFSPPCDAYKSSGVFLPLIPDVDLLSASNINDSLHCVKYEQEIILALYVNTVYI